ncbi:MAG: ISL3 family transposase, partial [Candidatus Fimenecus sp.]
RKIKDISAFGKYVTLIHNHRRYVCKECGKRFAEDNPFAPKYYRVTSRLINEILKKTESERSFTSIAKEVNLSVSTVIRFFDILSYTAPKELPEVLSIDEFKGNTGDEKYQVIITNPADGTVIDILPDRKQSHLISYFKQWDRSERSSVKFFVSDMWKPYAEISATYFKEATHLIDKYHYIRQVIWAFERVRKKIQKKYGKENRLLFKHSKRILTMRNSKLKPEQRERVEYLLYLNDDLRSAYYLKEHFYKILDCGNGAKCKELFSKWILIAENSRLSDYQDCAATFANWGKSILSTFDYPYTNGFTEGCNNKIKVLKRNAYGYRNFERFRKRILHMFNYKKANVQKAIA